MGHEISAEGKYALHQPRKEEIGKYKCSAENEVGHDKLTVQVYEISKFNQFNDLTLISDDLRYIWNGTQYYFSSFILDFCKN